MCCLSMDSYEVVCKCIIIIIVVMTIIINKLYCCTHDNNGQIFFSEMH